MYRLNAVHIETATKPRKKRDCFATRLALVIKMSNRTNTEFAEMVQNSIEEAGMKDYVRFTKYDINAAMSRGIQFKANKMAALSLATGLDRAFFEDFSRSPAEILKKTLKNK